MARNPGPNVDKDNTTPVSLANEMISSCVASCGGMEEMEEEAGEFVSCSEEEEEEEDVEEVSEEREGITHDFGNVDGDGLDLVLEWRLLRLLKLLKVLKVLYFM